MAIAMALTIMAGCSENVFDEGSVPDATPGQVTRVEPLCWWEGMKMPLQLMIYGPDISSSDIRVEGGKGLSVKSVSKAESPNYLFVDMSVSKAGKYWLVFSKDGEQVKYPYEILTREDGSASRGSFTTADMIYLVFPDRFANGDPSNDNTPDTIQKVDREANLERHGGDIQGIIDHLDYIKDLGATAIWATPVLLDDQDFESYHGYACCDYYHVDPRMGSNELYREFVSKAHAKGLKVIMDIVTNHCGTFHWWMKDLPFADWIHQWDQYTQTNICFSTHMDPNASKYDLAVHEGGWFVPMMPDMNLDNPFVLRYLQQWAIWWTEYAGLDGLRVDTFPYNEKEPISRWCKAVVDEYPNLNIVGECWIDSPSQLAYWQGGNENKDGYDSHLPSIMDFPLCDAIVAAVCEAGDRPGWNHGMTRVYNALSHDFVYHDLSKMMIFFANHDHSRMGDNFDHNPAKMKIAMSLLATLRGIPQLYNGDEMMFSARPGEWNDGSKRIDFPGGWEGDEADLFSEEGRRAAGKTSTADYSSAADLHDYTARLFNWRKDKEVIHSGKTLHFMTRDNTYAYFRYNDSDLVFVYINNTSGDVTVPWAHYAELVPETISGRNVITGEEVTLSSDTVVPAMTALIVECKR
ncbi:MAG: glycoside hydrolase family 13 protein [Bacteroidales bacterium]|nr:glycoside hydrolase family 13 protein [Bacteroidales bacterium]